VRIMIACGGTGGHVFPGVAIAEAIENANPRADVFFMGRPGSLEERIVAGTGRDFAAVPSMGVVRGARVRNVAVPFAVSAGYATALAHLLRRRPAAAVGTGGFASVPPILAAWTVRAPILLTEQNSHPGLATRILSRFAETVHVSFEESAGRLPHAREVVVSGNPVRSSFSQADPAGARVDLGLSPEARVVFFLGGSRGAHRINEAVRGAAAHLAERGIEVIAQTGEGDFGDVRARLDQAGVRAVVSPFFDRVEACYAAADLVVARAGATCIAELTLVGRPSILVPYPYAAEDHQMKNARAMESAGAALVVPDAELTGATIAARIDGLVNDRARLKEMADAARGLARRGAAERVARATLALATRRRPIPTVGGQRQ
jgi:UDP-N-acetylglucosamine--N-acetylmuramyl-(pentapeptide) pyrophosphoryl-undecaprenol N-acetylglucosamine transferase